MAIKYGQFFRELYRSAALRRQPVNGTFHLTNRCNLSCRMCYIREDFADMPNMGEELSSSAWLEMARQAVENGMTFLLLSGGEVFLRPDFFEIYEPLTRMGLLLSIFSNGTLVTKQIADRLAQAPPSTVEITIYGATAATYEAVTGSPRGFADCCAGIEALLSRGIPLGLKTTLTRFNVKELDAMRQMAHAWRIPLAGSWMLHRRPDGKASEIDSCRLAAEECVAIEATDPVSVRDLCGRSLEEVTKSQNDNFNCFAGNAGFVVTSHGEMHICPNVPFPPVKPLEIGFRPAWEELGQYVLSVPPVSPVCRSCGSRAYCGRCPGWSLGETGTLTEPVPYWCNIARTRMQRYG